LSLAEPCRYDLGADLEICSNSILVEREEGSRAGLAGSLYSDFEFLFGMEGWADSPAVASWINFDYIFGQAIAGNFPCVSISSISLRLLVNLETVASIAGCPNSSVIL